MTIVSSTPQLAEGLHGHRLSHDLEAWWYEHGGQPSDPAWAAWLQDYRRLIDGKWEELTTEHVNVNEDGGKAFGMSKAGGCTRAAVLKALGHEPEPFSGSTRFTFFLGHSIELMAIASLRALGYEVNGAQEPVYIGDMMASYSDAIMPDFEGQTTIVSVKSQGFKKALALDTEIPTPDGWRTVADIQPGDFVFGGDGKPVRVEYKSEVFRDNDCYRVSFKDGGEVVCDGEHLWQVDTQLDIGYNSQIPHLVKRGYSPTPRPPRVMTTAQMAAETGRVRIPVCEPVEYPEQQLIVDPYALGAWLGDGTLGTPVLTTVDAEILDEIERRGIHVERKTHIAHRLGTPGDGRGKHNSWNDSMRQLGLIESKAIPAEYMVGSIMQRVDLLRGLMDTDGSCRKASGACVFTNTNAVLVEQVRELLYSLGIRASVSSHTARIGNVEYGKAYHVAFTAPFEVFNLRRKADIQKFGTTKTRHRYVKSVTPVPSVPTQCVKVASADGLFLCTRDYTVTHNSGKEWRGKKSVWVRRGFPELPFAGVREAQPGWWAQVQAEMRGSGARQALILVAAKDIVKAMEGDPYLDGETGNGSLTWYAELIPYDEQFVENHLLPVWALAKECLDDGEAGPAYILNNKRNEYVALDKASTSWKPNADRSGTFNYCAYCDMFNACKEVK